MSFLLNVVLIFLLSTVVFDLIHYLLHKLLRSQSVFLARIGGWHVHHHLFFDHHLTNHRDLWKNNFRYHLLPEFLVQIVITLSCMTVFDPGTVVWALALEVFFFLYVVSQHGEDPNHTRPAETRRPSMNFYIFPSYHAFHHRYPDSYYGSWFRLTDFFLGHSWHSAGRTALITGSRGQFGRQISLRLQKEGTQIMPALHGVDFRKNDFAGFRAKAKAADLLILCHGSKSDMEWSHVTSTRELIRIFLEETETPVPEIWAIGSEIEFHPALLKLDKPYERAKRDFAVLGSELYHRKDILYRHLVPSAFNSSYGPAPVSAGWMASLALFLIKRGFRYVPLTYTGIAFLNYIRFRKLRIRPR